MRKASIIPGKTDRIDARVRPETKDEMVMAAHELNMSLGDLIETSFFYYWKEKAPTEDRRKAAEESYKLIERAARKGRPVRRAAVSISHELSLAKLIREIEKLSIPRSEMRRIYEKLLAQVRDSEELTSLVKAMFREYGISEPLSSSESMSIYRDFIRINVCGLHPVAHRRVDRDKLDERIDILLTNVPSKYYNIIADAQGTIWKLCGKEKTI